MGYKLQKIYIGQNQVRPDTWWKPWANTIAYYKFDWNLNDSSGNNRNLSMYTGSFSYTTTSWGAKYVRFNSSAYTNTLSIPFNRTAYTISGWYTLDAVSSSYQKILLDMRADSNYRPRAYSYNNEMVWVVSFEGRWATFVANSWYYIVTVYNNNVVTSYINTNVEWTETYSWSATSCTLRLNRASDNTSSIYGNGWGISELIIENKARTAQEISDYYNQTKANYWIS